MIFPKSALGIEGNLCEFGTLLKTKPLQLFNNYKKKHLPKMRLELG